MAEFKLGQLASAIGGMLIRGDAEQIVDNFVIDTRDVRDNGLFFALKGERTDGHRFLVDAAKRGAVAAVIQQDVTVDAAAPWYP